LIAEKVASLYGISGQEVAKQTTDNSIEIFKR